MSVSVQEDERTTDDDVSRAYYSPETGRVEPAGESPRPDGAVALPRIGEFVAVSDRGGLMVPGYWVGLATSPHRPVFPQGRLRVRLLSGGQVVEHELDASTLAAEHVVSGHAEGAVADAVAAVAEAWSRYDAQQCAHEEWKQRLTDSAHAEAADREWCQDFDDFMENVGLDRRERTYVCHVTVAANVTLCVSASSPEEAQDSITRDLVMSSVSLDTLDYEVTETCED